MQVLFIRGSDITVSICLLTYSLLNNIDRVYTPFVLTVTVYNDCRAALYYNPIETMLNQKLHSRLYLCQPLSIKEEELFSGHHQEDFETIILR